MATQSEKVSDYEKRRLQNLEDNKRVLAELGLLNPYLKLHISKRHSLPPAQQQKTAVKKSKTSEQKKRKSILGDVNDDNIDFAPNKRRKSARLRGIAPGDSAVLTSDEESTDNTEIRKAYVPRDNTYGHIDGCPVGTWWETRMECSRDGVHRSPYVAPVVERTKMVHVIFRPESDYIPTVAGIHGDCELGAYSVALSGGYEDNIDLGECFTYTGEGGRDLKGTKANPKNLRTAPQTKDQTLTRGNLALSQSVKTGNPVRVIRGYKLPTVFAPETGYRYDGLYNVTKAWYATGAAGFGVWKFAFKRCPDQDPLPFVVSQSDDDTEDSKQNTKENQDEV